MIENKLYLVIYRDPINIKSKKLIFVKRQGKILMFFNKEKGKHEFINEDVIVRMEELE